MASLTSFSGSIFIFLFLFRYGGLVYPVLCVCNKEGGIILCFFNSFL